MTWYANKNDLIGGWVVASKRAPLSQLDPELDQVIAETGSYQDALAIADILNASKLERVVTAVEGVRVRYRTPQYASGPTEAQLTAARAWSQYMLGSSEWADSILDVLYAGAPLEAARQELRMDPDEFERYAETYGSDPEDTSTGEES